MTYSNRALISTSNKSGLVEFAKELVNLNYELIATGGTARLLMENALPVTEVSDLTGFPEILGGRVKTLHPKIHGGILGRPGIDDTVMQNHGIQPIDLVVVNLYPFSQTILKPNCTFENAIEQIDIGGPTMLRAAAKNHQHVSVVVDPDDYPIIIDEIRNNGATQSNTRKKLALKTFAHTAKYDAAIANYLTQQCNSIAKDELPNRLTINAPKIADLRYGENPHQKAALYQNEKALTGSLAQAELLQGKPLSFNNLMDSHAALECVRALDKDLPGCVIVKHATPCGVAQGDNLLTAYEKAYATDSTSAFGGIIAFNQPLDAKTAEKITSQQFVEVILAPEFSEETLRVLSAKKNLRALATGFADNTVIPEPTLHSISGGILVQDADSLNVTREQLQVVTKRQPTPEEMADLLFAWRIVKFVKSNAIVYAHDQATLGLGTGQTSRVFSAKIAALKAEEAGLSLDGAAMASDAFFPFADGIEVAAQAGIKSVIQPGGSKRDQEVIDAADRLGIAMVFTGHRHFRH